MTMTVMLSMSSMSETMWMSMMVIGVVSMVVVTGSWC